VNDEPNKPNFWSFLFYKIPKKRSLFPAFNLTAVAETTAILLIAGFPIPFCTTDLAYHIVAIMMMWLTFLCLILFGRFSLGARNFGGNVLLHDLLH
jgi:hypothetical protein